MNQYVLFANKDKFKKKQCYCFLKIMFFVDFFFDIYYVFAYNIPLEYLSILTMCDFFDVSSKKGCGRWLIITSLKMLNGA